MIDKAGDVTWPPIIASEPARQYDRRMPFSTITTTPEDLSILSRAFDEAWAAITELKEIEATAQAAERERLAYLIIGLFKAGTDNLVGTAVSQFMQDERVSAARSDADQHALPPKA